MLRSRPRPATLPRLSTIGPLLILRLRAAWSFLSDLCKRDAVMRTSAAWSVNGRRTRLGALLSDGMASGGVGRARSVLNPPTGRNLINARCGVRSSGTERHLSGRHRRNTPHRLWRQDLASQHGVESLYKAGHEADEIKPVSWHFEQYLRSLSIVNSEALTRFQMGCTSVSRLRARLQLMKPPTDEFSHSTSRYSREGNAA